MQSNNETEDIPGGKQMKTKQITEEITIRKTMMYKRGAEMINIHTANLRPTKSLGVRETESMAVGD